MSEDDSVFMLAALKEAQRGFKQGEVPVGCVIVLKGKIIAKAHNKVEKLKNACKHAEVICIEKAAKKIGDFRLKDCILYTTLEPCLMCAGAILLSRIKKIIYAAEDFRHGALVSVYKVFEKKHPIHQPSFEKSAYSEESSRLLKDFFKIRREENER